MAARRQRAKSAAVEYPIPQSREDVDQCIARIGQLQRERTRLHTDKDEQMAKIDQEVKTRLQPIEDEIINLQKGVQAWCEVSRQVLTKNGKVKFHNFTSGVVKWRMRPAKVALRAVDMVIGFLKERKLDRFVRTKEEVNKEAILADPTAVEGIPGITVTQGEDFVVEPYETKLEEVSS